MTAGIAMLAGWITQSANFESRQAFPFFLLFIPALFALNGHYYCLLISTGSPAMGRPHNRLIALLGVLLCIALLGAAMVDKTASILHTEVEKNERIMRQQDIVLGAVRAHGAESLFVDTYAGGRWQSAVYQLLSPIQAVPIKTGASQIMIVSNYLARQNQLDIDAYLPQCGSILHFSKSILLCRLPDFENGEVDIQILDWGPKHIRANAVPSKQAHGGVGFWIKIRPVNLQMLGPVEMSLGGYPAFTTNAKSEQVITGEFSTRLFSKAGKHELQVRQLATGRIFHTGYFFVVREFGSISSLSNVAIAEVDRWGPQVGIMAEGSDSESNVNWTFWFLFTNIVQHPYEIYLGEYPLKTSVRSEKNLITAAATKSQAEQFTQSPSEIPIYLVDLVHGTKQLMGYFRIQAGVANPRELD